MEKDRDGSSLNIAWEGVTLRGRCGVCGEDEVFEIEPGQHSYIMKNLFPKMIAWGENKHAHEEYHAENQEG